MGTCLPKVTCAFISRHRADWHLTRPAVLRIEEVKRGWERPQMRGIFWVPSWGHLPLGPGQRWLQQSWTWLSSQDQDFQPLQPGAPIFQMFSGEDLLYDGESTVYPVFINEAAYYEKGIAFVQTEKFTFTVPAMPVLNPAPSPAS